MLLDCDRRSRGFTLIEILLVFALLGAFAIGMLATIDPFEQLKKSGDTSRLHLAGDFYNAVIRSYATRAKIPISTDVYGVALSSPEAQEMIQELKNFGELKTDFENKNAKYLDDMYLSASQDGKTLSVCFRPESKSYAISEQTVFDQYGLEADCASLPCNMCIGQSDESQVALHVSKVALSSCKTLGAECEINNSEKACCTGLLCEPYNLLSSNGKCVTDSLPTPTPTPTQAVCVKEAPSVPPTTDCVKDPHGPPTVSLRASDCVVTKGTPFTITVSGRSCPGLASVWWYGAGGPDVPATVVISYPQSPTSSQIFTVPFTNPTSLKRAYGSPLFSAAQDVKEYSFTSTLRIPQAGTYTFGANSRDVLYPVPGMPHQASEGMGIPFLQIQVVDSTEL